MNKLKKMIAIFTVLCMVAVTMMVPGTAFANPDGEIAAEVKINTTYVPSDFSGGPSVTINHTEDIKNMIVEEVKAARNQGFTPCGIFPDNSTILTNASDVASLEIVLTKQEQYSNNNELNGLAFTSISVRAKKSNDIVINIEDLQKVNYANIGLAITPPAGSDPNAEFVLRAMSAVDPTSVIEIPIDGGADRLERATMIDAESGKVGYGIPLVLDNEGFYEFYESSSINDGDGGSGEVYEGEQYGFMFGQNKPVILTDINGAPDDGEYYTYICAEDEYVNLTPYPGSEEWEEWDGDSWETVSLANKEEISYGAYYAQKDDQQKQFIRCKIADGIYYNYLLYLYTPVEETPDAAGEIRIIGKDHLSVGEETQYSSFINGILYDDMEAIVKEGKGATITVDVSDVAAGSVSKQAMSALNTVGKKDTKIIKYFKISVEKQIENESKTTVDWGHENIQQTGFVIPKAGQQQPAAGIVREYKIYHAAEYVDEGGNKTWKAQVAPDMYETDGSYIISTNCYCGTFKMTYIDKTEERYDYEQMLYNMGKADYHCGAMEEAQNGYYNAFNRSLWYAIYSGNVENAGTQNGGVPEFTLTIDKYHEMISELFDSSFDAADEMGLANGDTDKMVAAMKANLGVENDGRYWLLDANDNEITDTSTATPAKIVINTEINFGDDDHVKYRAAKSIGNNTTLLMGLFLHPIDWRSPFYYSDSPRIVTIDGSGYELLGSAELAVKKEPSDSSKKKIGAYDMYDYFVTNDAYDISLDQTGDQIALSPKFFNQDEGRESMHDGVTVSTHMRDFDKFRGLKLEAEGLEPSHAKDAIEKTDAEVEEIHSTDIYMHGGDNTPVEVDDLNLSNKELKVRIRIPREWVENGLKLRNIRAYYIPAEDGKKAELFNGELKVIDGEYFYVFKTTHFSEYSLALLTDESVANLPDADASSSQSGKAAKTGDTTNTTLLFLIMAASAVTAAGALMLRRRAR